VRTVRGFLHAPDGPLFLDGTRAGGLPGAKVLTVAKDHLEAGHGVGDIPLVRGHDHRLTLQQAAHHRLCGPRHERHVEPDALLLDSRYQLAKGDTRLHHGDAACAVDEHDLLHAAQIDDNRATGARHRIAAEVRGTGAHRHERSEAFVGKRNELLDLAGGLRLDHERRPRLVDETHVLRVGVERLLVVGDIRSADYLYQLLFINHRLFLASFTHEVVGVGRCPAGSAASTA
jgi:hypothetical protein